MKTTRLLLTTLLVGTLAVSVSCSDAIAPQTAAQANTDAPALLDELTATASKSGLLSCTPMPAVTVSQVVGKAGGTIKIGPHFLTIPKGALSGNVTITAHSPSDKVNRVEFQPHGLTFAKSAALTMSYANCKTLGSLLPKHIAYVDGNLSILYLLQSVDDFKRKQIKGELDHFSEYAVAW